METGAAAKTSPPRKVVYRTIGSQQAQQPPVVTTVGQAPPTKKFGFPWAFVMALGILAVIEVGLRFVDPVKLLPRQGGLSEYQAALLHMEMFGPGDVAFLGSSRTREGIHAAQLQRMVQEELGKDVRVVNYSCP